jgi:hypothetical protein
MSDSSNAAMSPCSNLRRNVNVQHSKPRGCELKLSRSISYCSLLGTFDCYSMESLTVPFMKPGWQLFLICPTISGARTLFQPFAGLRLAAVQRDGSSQWSGRFLTLPTRTNIKSQSRTELWRGPVYDAFMLSDRYRT